MKRNYMISFWNQNCIIMFYYNIAINYLAPAMCQVLCISTLQSKVESEYYLYFTYTDAEAQKNHYPPKITQFCRDEIS